MVAHRLGNPGPRSVAVAADAAAPPRRRRSPWVGHLAVCGLGVLGILYLALVWRAASLEAQVALVEERLASVEFEHLRARRQLTEVLPQAAPIGEFISSPTAPRLPLTSQAIRCPALPPVEPSALSALAGTSTPEGAPAPPQPPAAPPHTRVVHRADLP